MFFPVGCSDEPTPEQLRADAAFEEARSALAGGDSHRGRELLLGALSLEQAYGRKQRLAEEYRMLGDLSATAAEFDSAFEAYALALENYREVADRAGARVMTLSAARLHRKMGKERTAFATYTEALRLARVFHEEEGVRQILWQLLPCARELGEGEEEGRILRELLDASTAQGDIAEQAAVLLESGRGKYGAGAYDRAAEDILRAIVLADQARDSLLVVRATMRLAMTFEAAGRIRDALASYGDCLKRSDRTRGASALRLEALIRVGNLYLWNRRFPDAMRFFRAAYPSARAIGNSIAEGYLLLQLGHCEVESSRESALKMYRSGLEVFKNLGHPAGLAYAYLSLGHLFQRNNQPTDALQYFKWAIDQSEAVTAARTAGDLSLSFEQAYFGTRPTPWYDDAIDILLQLGRYDEAFWYADRRNSRELFGALSEVTLGGGGDSVRPLLEAYGALRARYVGAQRAFVDLAVQHGPRRDLLQDARAARDRWSALAATAAAAAAKARRALEPFVRVSSVGIPEVQRTLPPGTALIQPILARRSLYLFVITGARSDVQIAAFEKDRVFDLAREFTEVLSLHDTYADSSAAQQTAIELRLREVNSQLYEAFIRPVENAIAGTPTLLVILPRELPWFPLHALSKGGLRGGGYLAAQHTISYLPSAGSALLPRAPQRPVKDVVALGYAGGSGWDVEYELRDIRAFYKEVRLYFGQQASLATLQKERGDVLHIAARFLYDADRPGASCVVLSDGKSADVMKRIPAGELMGIPPSMTVIVSDLDGGRLGIRPAEPYLFLANGTQQVIFTSRTPSRKAKKLFGELFYTSVLGGAASRTAYHEAQVAMIKSAEFGRPSAWAWFTLWGK
jgi:tetratricopeptide (TPR) repeat protein